MPKISFLRLAVSSINSLQIYIYTYIYIYIYVHINRVLILKQVLLLEVSLYKQTVAARAGPVMFYYNRRATGCLNLMHDIVIRNLYPYYDYSYVYKDTFIKVFKI